MFYKVRNETRVSILSTLIQLSLAILSQSKNTGRRNKVNMNWKGNSQTTPICRWHDLIPERNKTLHQKTPRYYEQLQQSSRIHNLQNSVGFLHTNNEHIEKEYRKIISFRIISKKIPSNKLNKEYERTL
jgi:hypothetical protein